MATRAVDIQGFDQLNSKLRLLGDRIKRRELLKVMRPVAREVSKVYSANLPVGDRPHKRYTKGGGVTTYQPGNLAKSVAVKTVGIRYSRGNASLVVRPDKRGSRYDGYYRFMVVPKGFKGKGRGSRKGSNTVVGAAKKRTLQATAGRSTQQLEDKVSKLIQRNIDKLST